MQGLQHSLFEMLKAVGTRSAARAQKVARAAPHPPAAARPHPKELPCSSTGRGRILWDAQDFFWEG